MMSNISVDPFPLSLISLPVKSSIRAAALGESDRIEMALSLVELECLVIDLPGYLLPKGRGK